MEKHSKNMPVFVKKKQETDCSDQNVDIVCEIKQENTDDPESFISEDPLDTIEIKEEPLDAEEQSDGFMNLIEQPNIVLLEGQTIQQTQMSSVQNTELLKQKSEFPCNQCPEVFQTNEDLFYHFERNHSVCYRSATSIA